MIVPFNQHYSTLTETFIEIVSSIPSITTTISTTTTDPFDDGKGRLQLKKKSPDYGNVPKGGGVNPSFRKLAL